MDRHDAETVEIVKPQFAAKKYFVESPGESAFEFGAASHTGLHRAENQDHYLVLRRTRTAAIAVDERRDRAVGSSHR